MRKEISDRPVRWNGDSNHISRGILQQKYIFLACKFQIIFFAQISCRQHLSQ